MTANVPWWGPISAMTVIVLTWLACLVCGHLYGAHVGWTLFVLIELRATFAVLVGRWKIAAAQSETTSCATVRIDIR